MGCEPGSTAPGADRITSALTISLTLLLTGHELAESIEHPRLHYELDRDTVAVETLARLAISAMFMGSDRSVSPGQGGPFQRQMLGDPDEQVDRDSPQLLK